MQQKKILVVEDEQALLTLYASVLEKGHNGYSFDVYRAGNYEEAMVLSNEHNFDILLTDYHLPGKDGINLIKSLKQKDTGIACIIISGYLSQDIVKAAKDAGAYTCLKKPCSIYMIKGTIEEALKYQKSSAPSAAVSETISPHREIQCLIDNYPTETVFIDKSLSIQAVNPQFKMLHPEALNKTCYSELYNRTQQCGTCPLNDTNAGAQLFYHGTLASGERINEQIDAWYDREGVHHGYIVSCVLPAEDETTGFLEKPQDTYFFFALDEQGTITYADNAVTQLFNHGDDIIGQSIAQYLHSYFIQLLIKEDMSFLQYAEKNSGHTVSLDFITKDSLIRRTLECELRINKGGFPPEWKVIVIGTDTSAKNEITRLIEFGKETFQQLRTGQFDMVFTIDRSMVIKTINRVTLAKLNARQKDMIGSNMKNLLYNRRDRYAFEQAIHQVQTLKNVYNLRLDLKYQNNKIASLVNISAVRDSFNDEMGYVLVCHDIERQLRMETTLQSIERMRALGQLAAGIAHQINNYTNAIYGSTDLLSDTLKENFTDHPEVIEETETVLRLIRGSIHRLTGLTKHLTTFARAQQPPVISPGDVNRVIIDIMSLLCSQADKKEVSLKTELDDQLPQVPFSPLHLEQGLLNIIMNAMDAVAEKTGKILITTYRDNDNIYIAVKDNGPGIPEEIKHQLFEAFVTTKPAGVGTGLGLNIAKNIIESLKGDITVDSGPGGTIMTLRIPIHNSEVIS
ncbi:MAG: response regulator [Spirochaetales bacterium]|nr:response regulator [Spirochaetales bacterium]